MPFCRSIDANPNTARTPDTAIHPGTAGVVMRVIVGVDVGGTNIVVGTVTEDGKRVSGIQRRDTKASQGPDSVVPRIAEAVRDSLNFGPATGIGPHSGDI